MPSTATISDASKLATFQFSSKLTVETVDVTSSLCHQPYSWVCTTCGAGCWSHVCSSKLKLTVRTGTRPATIIVNKLSDAKQELLESPSSFLSSSNGPSASCSSESSDQQPIETPPAVRQAGKGPGPLHKKDSHPKAMIDASRYKTQLCRRFALKGSCRFRSTCCFAHGDEELRTTRANVEILKTLPADVGSDSKLNEDSGGHTDEYTRTAMKAIMRCNAKKERRKNRFEESVAPTIAGE
eukprot:NODE_4294_length_833_cov_7.344388_g3966_i0.p1 GENE.NODE_4294_length_833_cov_7.344388_g3966_i0~~NODE_4294_length_833_cov_7.344388_g3966_i0.p1  ORF type:complete len:248 (-),score=25.63 NODE_4294_length_833_cov_7.344388_g3966_i0:89-808(-)